MIVVTCECSVLSALVLVPGRKEKKIELRLAAIL